MSGTRRKDKKTKGNGLGTKMLKRGRFQLKFKRQNHEMRLIPSQFRDGF